MMHRTKNGTRWVTILSMTAFLFTITAEEELNTQSCLHSTHVSDVPQKPARMPGFFIARARCDILGV